MDVNCKFPVVLAGNFNYQLVFVLFFFCFIMLSVDKINSKHITVNI